MMLIHNEWLSIVHYLNAREEKNLSIDEQFVQQFLQLHWMIIRSLPEYIHDDVQF